MAVFWTITLFISWNVLMVFPSHDSRALSWMDSMSVTMLLTASGRNDLWTSFLSCAWYSPWWKKRACGPIMHSLLLGKVGLKRWACFTNTNLAASGLAIIIHGQPNIWVLKMSPYLHTQKSSFNQSGPPLHCNLRTKIQNKPKPKQNNEWMKQALQIISSYAYLTSIPIYSLRKNNIRVQHIITGNNAYWSYNYT